MDESHEKAQPAVVLSGPKRSTRPDTTRYPETPRDTSIYHEAAGAVALTALDLLGNKERRVRDQKSERQLLHRLLSRPEEQVEALGNLRNDLFTLPTRQHLSTTITHLLDRGYTLSPESIREHLSEKTRNPIELPGLYSELTYILQEPVNRTVPELLESLEHTWRSRMVSQSIFQEASRRFDEGEDVDNLAGFMEELLLQLDPRTRKKIAWRALHRQVHHNIKHPDPKRRGLMTGLRDIDMQLGGLKRDRLITIGGYTGSGKTAFIIDLLYRILYHHRDKVAIKFWTLEMSEPRIIQRLYSRAAQVSVKRQDDWMEEYMENLTPKEEEMLDSAADLFDEFEGAIDVEYMTLNVKQMKASARQFSLKNKGKHCFFFLDHMGLMEDDSKDNRMKFDRIINACKDIARNQDATVFPLIQLDKSVESPKNKSEFYRPGASNIMESVGVEAASDAVFLLWRPSKFFEEIPYVHAGLGIDAGADEGGGWDCRHRLVLVNVKNRDGMGFNDVVLDADMAHNTMYDYDDMRKKQPDTFRRGGQRPTTLAGDNVSIPLGGRIVRIVNPQPPDDDVDLPF